MFPDRRVIYCSLCLMSLGLMAASDLQAKYRAVARNRIEPGVFEKKAPKIRFKTRLENREIEGWLVAATDSSLVIYVKDGGYGAATPLTSGKRGAPEVISDKAWKQRWRIPDGVRDWRARGMREISNDNLVRIEIDKSSTCDLSNQDGVPVSGATIGGKPDTTGGKPN
jgi:hypothetical protein